MLSGGAWGLTEEDVQGGGQREDVRGPISFINNARFGVSICTGGGTRGRWWEGRRGMGEGLRRREGRRTKGGSNFSYSTTDRLMMIEHSVCTAGGPVGKEVMGGGQGKGLRRS